MLKILVSNDDGVLAPGIQILSETLSSIAKIDVIAPDRNRSGASNSLTLHTPLRIRELYNGHISVEGTPTDCVHLAITGLLKELPDLVVAGINDGANLGDDVFYSGTVAAAMEGRFLGTSAIAASLVMNGGGHYDTAARVIKDLVEKFQRKPFPTNTILNVNVPDLPFDKLAGYEITRMGTRHKAEPTIEDKDPRGHTIYWVGPAGPEQDAGPGTDFHAIKNNKVSITPLHLDLTHYDVFDQLGEWI